MTTWNPDTEADLRAKAEAATRLERGAVIPEPITEPLRATLRLPEDTTDLLDQVTVLLFHHGQDGACPGPSSVRFRVYEHAGIDDEEPVERPVFSTGDGCGPSTLDPNEADCFAHGELKWDGCSNVRFAEGFFHHCSRRQFDVAMRGVMLARLEAARRMPWSGDLAPDYPELLELDQ